MKRALICGNLHPHSVVIFMNKKIKRGIKNEHGAIMVVLAVGIAVFLAFAALVIDIGLSYHQKAKLQSASDAVSLAVSSMVSEIADFNPTKNAKQANNMKNWVQSYYEENGINAFQNISGNLSDTNIYVYNIKNKESVINTLDPNKDAVYVFWKSVNSTDDVVSYRYIEVYSHMKTNAIFGGVLDIDSYNLTCDSAAKCEVIRGGNPDALNYQILNLGSDESFDITGPIENTFVKSITNFMENGLNIGLDFLQNDTRLISKYIMGGKVRYKCPNPECPYVNEDGTHGYIGSEDEFWLDASASPTGQAGYFCPKCSTECTEDDSNRVDVNITTSAAVVNGYIHSNHGASIDIDTFRLRSSLYSAVQTVTCENPTCGYVGAPEEFETRYVDSEQNSGSKDTIIFTCPKCGTETTLTATELAEANDIDTEKSNEFWTVYKNGVKESNRPLLELSGSSDDLIISGNNNNDIYFLGDPLFIYGQDSSVSYYFRTVYKSAQDAKPWDAARVNKQFVFGAAEVADPGFIEYIHTRFNYDTIADTDNTVNVGSITRLTSGSTYAVQFGGTASGGENYSWDEGSGTLTISGASIPNYTRGNPAPWKNLYGSSVQKIVVGPGVTSIGEYAFYGLNNVSSVTLSDSVLSIGRNAFSGCRSLTSIYIPSSVQIIDSYAFNNSGVSTFYGVEGSYIQTWCSSNRKAFSSDYADTGVSGSAVAKFDMAVDPLSLLDEIDLGNDTALPSVYSVYDNYNRFDYNFDGVLDSVGDVINNTVPMVENGDANVFNSLNPVEKVIYDKGFNITAGAGGDDSAEDTVRPTIDAKVTAITGDIHNEALRGDDDFKSYYDINISKAVNTKRAAMQASLSTIENNYIQRAITGGAYASGSIADNVSTKYTYNRNEMKRELFGANTQTGSLYDTPILYRTADTLYTSYVNQTMTSLQPTHFQIGDDDYNAEDFIEGRDGVKVDGKVLELVNNYIQDAPDPPTNDWQTQYNNYTGTWTKSVCQTGTNWGAITGTDNKWKNDPQISGYAYISYINTPRYKKSWTTTTTRNVIFNGGCKAYVDGDTSFTSSDGKGIQIQSGTSDNYTYVYFRGNVSFNENEDTLTIGDNCVVIIEGDVYVWTKGKSISIGSNSILVVKGKIQNGRGGDFNIGNNSRVYCANYYGATEHSSGLWVPANNNINVGTNSYFFTTGTLDLQDGGGTVTANNGSVISVGTDFWFNNGGNVVLNTTSQMFVNGYMRVQGYNNNNGNVTINDGCLLVADGFRIYKGGTTTLNGSARMIATGNGSGSSDTSDSGAGSYSGVVDCSEIVSSTSATISAHNRVFSGGNNGLSAIGNLFVVNNVEATKNDIHVYGKAVVGGTVSVGSHTTYVENNAVLVTPSVSGALSMGANSVTVVESSVNLGSSDLTCDNSTLYCSGTLTAKDLYIKSNSKIHVDENINLSGVIFGTNDNAQNWVLSCKGDITSTAGTGDSVNSVATGSYIFCEGNMTFTNRAFTNNGTVYCFQKFKSKSLVNSSGANFYVNASSENAIEIDGSIKNYGNIYAGTGGIYCTRDSSNTGIDNFDGAVIVSMGKIDQNGNGNNSSITNKSGSRIYAAGEMHCYKFKGETGQYTLCEGNLNLWTTNSDHYSDFSGQTAIGKALNGNNNAGINVYGSLTVNGLDCSGFNFNSIGDDWNSNGSASDPALANATKGIFARYLHVRNGGKMYVRGMVYVKTGEFDVYNSDANNNYFSIAVIDGGIGKMNHEVLHTGSYMSVDRGDNNNAYAQLYVDGNAYIGSSSNNSIYLKDACYMRITGTVKVNRGIVGGNVQNNSFIHFGGYQVEGGDTSIGTAGMEQTDADNTVFYVDNNVECWGGKLHNYATTYIGGNAYIGWRWSDGMFDFAVDDKATVYVGGDVFAAYWAQFNFSNAFIAGNVNVASGGFKQLNESGDNGEVSGTAYIVGNIVSNGEIVNEGIGAILSGGNITSTGAITGDSDEGIIYAAGNIEFNAATSSVFSIFYSDAIIRSNYSTESTINIVFASNLQYESLVNCRSSITDSSSLYTYVSLTRDSSSLLDKFTVVGDNAIYNENNPNLNKRTVIDVTGYNLILSGKEVRNAGIIICRKDSSGRGGSITIKKKGGTWSYLVNTGTIYCDGNLRIEGTNTGPEVTVPFNVGETNYGLSLQNGNSQSVKGDIYVMGEILTYGAIDNYNKIYAGGDVHTTTLIKGTTSTDNNGLDNEDNSVLMAGGSITADINPDNNNEFDSARVKSGVATNQETDETIIARRNSVFLALGNVRCSYAFIVGDHNFYDSANTATTQFGSEQFKYLTQQSYHGFDRSAAGYVRTNMTDVSAIQLTADENDVNYYGNFTDLLYDETGNKILNLAGEVGNYFTYSATANGKNGSTYNDFGFAYIGGTLTASNRQDANGGNNQRNYIRNFGKSVIYVAGNTINDGYQNPRGNALETYFMYLYPYSRMYVGGNLETHGGYQNIFSSNNGLAFDSWFYAHLYVNGNATFPNGKAKVRDCTKTLIAGNLTLTDYFELGKSPDEGERDVKEAYDQNNFCFMQIGGNFQCDGYVKIFERSTMNVNGNFSNLSGWSIPNHYLTMRHHSALRVGGNIECSKADIGSNSTVWAGGSFKAGASTIKIRDNCDISVGGNGAGDIVALSYIEIGKHENEAYKYKTWAENRPQGVYVSQDDIINDEGDADGPEEASGVDVDVNMTITCPNCGREGTISGGQFTCDASTDDVQYTCASCHEVFDDSADAFEGDTAIGSRVYVNGTINTKTSYLKLFANTQAYATSSIRSYRYIALRHHAGLYVTTQTPQATGIMFNFDSQSRLLDTNGNVVNHFYVDTDENSSEYGNIYYWPASFQYQDADNNAQHKDNQRLYGFTVIIDESESFDVDRSKGRLEQNMLYFYENGVKTYPYTVLEVESDGNIIEQFNYVYIDSSLNAVQDESGDDHLNGDVFNGGSAIYIDLPVTEGSIVSYGDLDVNTLATCYATGDIKSYGKTYIGNEALIFTKGNYMCTSLISLGSLFNGRSICGFEMKHGHLYADGDVKIYSCSQIGGGTIDAVGDVTFDSVYTHYEYEYVDENTNPYTDPTDIDLFIASEDGNINFNSIYSYTGGVTYAPNGTIAANGIAFVHYGCFIASDNNINAFYINLHRLANLSSLDLKWTAPGNVFLCEPMDN